MIQWNHIVSIGSDKCETVLTLTLRRPATWGAVTSLFGTCSTMISLMKTCIYFECMFKSVCMLPATRGSAEETWDCLKQKTTATTWHTRKTIRTWQWGDTATLQLQSWQHMHGTVWTVLHAVTLAAKFVLVVSFCRSCCLLFLRHCQPLYNGATVTTYL